jgi:hypothetical protein
MVKVPIRGSPDGRMITIKSSCPERGFFVNAGLIVFGCESSSVELARVILMSQSLLAISSPSTFGIVIGY